MKLLFVLHVGSEAFPIASRAHYTKWRKVELIGNHNPKTSRDIES